jgi:deoxycytidylate deaminase
MAKNRSRNARGIAAAIKAAGYSIAPHFRVGSALMSGSEIISTGWNQTFKTSPASTSRYCSIHSELHCTSGVDRNKLHRATLYVVRVTPGGRISMARPCQDCWKIIKLLPITKVIWSDNLGNFIEERVAA